MTKTTTIPVGGVMVELIDDGDAIARMTNNGKDWEPATRAIWGALVRPGDMVIDVGAYTGVYSIASALIGAKVIALEPHPANFRRLRDNAAINSVRMEMIEAAASVNQGSNCLYMKRATTAICDTASLDQEQAVAVSVRTVRLDDLKLCAQVCLLKIDVEHHELDVLAGAIRLITTHRPAIVVEVLSVDEAMAVDACLYDLGYRSDITLDRRNRFYRYGSDAV
jgi:FkbM family methyltransferase